MDSQCIKVISFVTELNHKLAVTNNGLLGFVPKLCQPKDHVVVFPGCWLPVIGRKLDADDTYQIIGDAFILDLRGKQYELKDGWTVSSSTYDYEGMFFHLQERGVDRDHFSVNA